MHLIPCAEIRWSWQWRNWCWSCFPWCFLHMSRHPLASLAKLSSSPAREYTRATLLAPCSSACLTTHNMVQQLRSELNLLYLDDGTLGGSLDEVLVDFWKVEQSAGELGLQLNLGKTEMHLCRDINKGYNAGACSCTMHGSARTCLPVWLPNWYT